MEQKIQDGDSWYTVGDHQHVDISQIRQFITDAMGRIGGTPQSYPACLRSIVDVGPMALELCDLVENSGFLNDVEQARVGMEAEDSPTLFKYRIRAKTNDGSWVEKWEGEPWYMEARNEQEAADRAKESDKNTHKRYFAYRVLLQGETFAKGQQYGQTV